MSTSVEARTAADRLVDALSAARLHGSVTVDRTRVAVRLSPAAAVALADRLGGRVGAIV